MSTGTRVAPPLKRDDIARALNGLGLGAGHIVFVHSSLRSMGHVEGGADAVVDALLDVLGPDGTLAVPTFTGSVRRPGVLYDPATTSSEVGRITEVVRNRPGAFRSPHLWQSMASLGKRAEEMMSIHRPVAWAADGPFWKLYEWDARILLLGVPYFRSTFWHLIEQWLQPAYGRWRETTGRVRNPDGTESPLKARTFGPKPGYTHDFNKLGARLEARGLVSVGAVGNAIARLFRARDAFDVGVAEFRDDPMLFVTTGKDRTQLRDGVEVVDPGNMYSQ